MRSTPWWGEKTNAAHSSVVSTFRALDEEQVARKELDLHHLRLYSNRMYTGLAGADWSVYNTGDKLKLNICKAVVNTATAMNATNKTRTMFLTKGGTRKQRQRGKDLGKYCVGLRRRVQQHIRGLEVYRDGMIFGDGFQRIAPDMREGGFISERVLPYDVIVDEIESRDGGPRTLYRYRDVDPHVLAARYPGKKSEIMGSSWLRESIVGVLQGPRLTSEQPVSTVEAIRLPDSPGDKGRRIVCTDKATLIDEPWDLPYFPYLKWSWDPAVIGWRGQGAIEEISPVQVEINYLLQKAQAIMTLNTAQLWVKRGSKINVGGLSNADMAINEYRDRPPVLLATNAVPTEILNQIDRLWDRGFEALGVSRMTATGEKPAGLNSGAAIRTYRDTTNKRFLHQQQRWEEHNVAVDERYIDAARALVEGGKSLTVDAPGGRGGIEELNFSALDLDRDKFMMQPYPVSFLPDEPAGQMQTLKEFAEISPAIRDMLLQKMRYPDLDDAVAKANAPVNLVELIIERAIDRGEWTEPEPFIDPKISLPMVRTAILMAEQDEVDDGKIQILREYMTATVDLWEADQPAPLPPGAGPTPGNLAAIAPIPEQPGPQGPAVPV